MTTLEETELFAQLEKFKGYGYSLLDPKYPERFGTVRGRLLSPPKQTNCSCFAEGLIVPVALQVDRALMWTPGNHADFMIYDGSRLYSPVEVLHQTRLAVQYPDSTPLLPWTVVQGWRRNNTGHTFFIVRHCPTTDRALVLEASGALRGVGWRGIGTIDAVGCTIPPEWQKKTSTTWTQLRSEFPRRRLAKLNVRSSAPISESLSSPSQSLSVRQQDSFSGESPGPPQSGGEESLSRVSCLQSLLSRLAEALWSKPLTI